MPARVTLSATGTEASVVLHELAAGGGFERSIAGADCDEVASAAALILAVALGSSSAEEPSGPVEPRRPVEQRGAGGGRGADPRIDAPPVPSTSGQRRWSIALGASAEANAWTGPWPAGVVGVSVDAVSPSRGWSARVAGVYGSSERAVDDRRAGFSYWGGHLDVCPIVLGGVAAWRWASCAELHLGRLLAEGDERSSLASGSSERALLATAVAAMRVETPPLWAVRLQVEAGLGVPLVRQTFQFGAPEQVMFESPAVGLLGRAGIVVPLDGQRD